MSLAAIAKSPSESQQRQPYRIVLIDDRVMQREVITRRMRKSGVFRVLMAASFRDAMQSDGESIRSEIVLIIVHGSDGYQSKNCGGVICKFATQSPGTRVIVASDNDMTVLSCLEAGAVGYVDDGLSWEDFKRQLIDVYEGKACPSPGILAALVNQIQDRSDGMNGHSLIRGADCLSRRESEVARMMATGWSNKEISGELEISLSTIKNHVHSVLRKLGVRHRHELLGRVF